MLHETPFKAWTCVAPPLSWTISRCRRRHYAGPTNEAPVVPQHAPTCRGSAPQESDGILAKTRPASREPGLLMRCRPEERQLFTDDPEIWVRISPLLHQPSCVDLSRQHQGRCCHVGMLLCGTPHRLRSLQQVQLIYLASAPFLELPS